MPPPDMPPSIRKPQKSSPSASLASRMIVSVNSLVTQGMIRFERAVPVLGRQAAEPADVGHGDAARIWSKISRASRGPAIHPCPRSRYWW